MPEWRDLLLVEGGAGSDRTMASALQHGAAAFVARLQATGATSYLAEGNGAWRYGKRCAFPTSPHPRLRLRTRLEKGATLTFHLVQKIGQVTVSPTVYSWHLMNAYCGFLAIFFNMFLHFTGSLSFGFSACSAVGVKQLPQGQR